MVEKNEEVRNKLIELFRPYEGKALTSEEKSKLIETLLLPLAEENGLLFNMEDWIDFMKELKTNQSGEVLSDDELDSVAGGYVNQYPEYDGPYYYKRPYYTTFGESDDSGY